MAETHAMCVIMSRYLKRCASDLLRGPDAKLLAEKNGIQFSPTRRAIVQASVKAIREP
jgi:hypothetical protein